MFWSKDKVKLKDLKPCSVVNWSQNQLNMINDVKENYSENISKLWISNKNEIIDGNHRYLILINKYGGEHELNVFRFNMSMKTYNTIFLIFFPISLGLILPVYLLIQRYRKQKWGKKQKMDSKVESAGIFIINKNFELLICHPTKQKKNFWTIPKGKIDNGEYVIDAALRETYEESNVYLFPYIQKLIELPPINYKHKNKMLHPFVLFESDCNGLDLSDIELKCNSKLPESMGGYNEIDDYKWVNIDNAITLLHESQVKCLEKINILINKRKTISDE